MNTALQRPLISGVDGPSEEVEGFLEGFLTRVSKGFHKGSTEFYTALRKGYS